MPPRRHLAEYQPTFREGRKAASTGFRPALTCPAAVRPGSPGRRLPLVLASNRPTRWSFHTWDRDDRRARENCTGKGQAAGACPSRRGLAASTRQSPATQPPQSRRWPTASDREPAISRGSMCLGTSQSDDEWRENIHRGTVPQGRFEARAQLFQRPDGNRRVSLAANTAKRPSMGFVTVSTLAAPNSANR